MLNQAKIRVQAILNAMQAVIAKHALEVLQRYPNDLLVHDKAILEKVAVPGAKIAWMVGHSHTHMVSLGFHKQEGMNVEGLINLANEDRFYVLNICSGEKFTMTEVDRKDFSQLGNTPVHYEREGGVDNFWLLHHKNRVGHIGLKRVNSWIEAKITPLMGITEHQLAALEIWCSCAIVELAGSLFVKSDVNWAEPLRLEQAA
jgi:hypothetical protein